MCLSLLLLGCFFMERASGIEPGADKKEFESIEEVNSHEDDTQTEQEPEDITWMPDAVLDVGYYLRKYKYNGYDPRYQMETGVTARNLYIKFPTPPLKALHWEVKKNCETSFGSCLSYLHEKVMQMELPRHLDSITVIKHNGWTMDKDEDLIKATNAACLQLKERDETTFNVFQTPLHKFQWLITASYYMCWYTMREVPHLKMFYEACDNYANCLDPETGLSNGDYRADDGEPFACALYSFCPDPCCPEKRVTSPDTCEDSNPCGRQNLNNRTCTIDRRENVDMDSILLNYWNFSCNCDGAGMRWESRSGMCVDIDECIEYPKTCDFPSESCMNLPGTYRCVCSMMGYEEDASGKCVPDPIMQRVLYPPKVVREDKKKAIGDNFFDLIHYIKHIFSVSNQIQKEELERELNITEGNVDSRFKYRI